MLSLRTLICVLVTAVMFSTQAIPSSAKRSQEDIAYGPHKRHHYDAYLPSPSDANGAAVVFLHGGGWRIGDKRNRGVWVAKSRHLNAQGVAFFSINTRLLPDANPLEQTRDLAAALSHIQQNAGVYGIAPDRIVLMGHSAGAHIAVLLSSDPTIGQGLGLIGWAGTVALDTAVYDTAAFMNADPSQFHRAAFGRDADFWDKTSPKARLRKIAAPFLIVCSTLRQGVCASSSEFAKRAHALGVQAEVVQVPLTHRQINVELGTSDRLTSEVDKFLRARLRY